MPEIRYVVLSDLHFGAENSVLTSVVEDPPDPVPDAVPAPERARAARRRCSARTRPPRAPC